MQLQQWQIRAFQVDSRGICMRQGFTGEAMIWHWSERSLSAAAFNVGNTACIHNYACT